MSEFNSDINKKAYHGYADNLPNDDKRLEDYQKQRLERGFDDTECWNLDITIASFIAPRLKELIKTHEAYVKTDEYYEEMNALADAFEEYATSSKFDNKESFEVIKKLFPKYFTAMWN